MAAPLVVGPSAELTLRRVLLDGDVEVLPGGELIIENDLPPATAQDELPILRLAGEFLFIDPMLHLICPAPAVANVSPTVIYVEPLSPEAALFGLIGGNLTVPRRYI